MISQKYYKYLLIILILILLYNLFFIYRHSLIEGMVSNAKDCFSNLKKCLPPKNNKNSECHKIEKDSSGNYYQVCPSDNIDNECSQYCPYNWKFEVDSSGNELPNSNVTKFPNEKYNMISDHNNSSGKEDTNQQIISINFNSGSDTHSSPLNSNNLLTNYPPFTSQYQCTSSPTGAFTDCGPLPYNSAFTNANQKSNENMIKNMIEEFMKLGQKNTNSNNNELNNQTNRNQEKKTVNIKIPNSNHDNHHNHDNHQSHHECHHHHNNHNHHNHHHHQSHHESHHHHQPHQSHRESHDPVPHHPMQKVSSHKTSSHN